jgi:hypothetical protein
MSTVLFLALRTLFFFWLSMHVSISPLVLHFLSILLSYLHPLYCILYLGLVDLGFFCAPHVIARVANSMSGLVFADELEV